QSFRAWPNPRPRPAEPRYYGGQQAKQDQCQYTQDDFAFFGLLHGFHQGVSFPMTQIGADDGDGGESTQRSLKVCSISPQVRLVLGMPGSRPYCKRRSRYVSSLRIAPPLSSPFAL